MSNNRKNIWRKIVTFTVCILIVFGTAFQYSLALGLDVVVLSVSPTVTSTDFVVSPELGDKDAEITAITPSASAVQYKNVLLSLEINRSDINTGQLCVYSDFSVDFHKFFPADIQPLRANTMVNTSYYESSGYIYVDILSSYNFTQGTKLINFCFNSPNTVASPEELVHCLTIEAYTDSGEEVDDAFTYQTVVLGDVNGDTSIDAKDQLLVLQYAVGKVELNELQVLAADVNMDGAINAVDAMKIGRYAVEKILSFWDENWVNLPLGTAQGVASNFIYQIKNYQSGHHLYADSNNNAYFVSSSNTDSHRFAIELADDTRPIYHIKNIVNGKYLRLNRNYKTTFLETNVIADSQYWYIIPAENGFKLINFACTERALTTYGGTAISTTNCGTGYIDYGSVWQLEDQQVAISYYYDNAFYQRYKNNWASTLENVENKQSDIAAIINNIFGIGVITETPVYKQSYGDQCTGYNYSANCPSGHATNASCTAYDASKQLSTAHHKNSSANLHHMYNGKTVENKHKLFVMFSGHIPCGKDDNGAHAYSSVAGIANRSRMVCTVYRNGNGTASDNTVYRDQYTALHEVSHCLGAKKGAGLTPDTEHEQGVCVMSYARDEATLASYWNAQSANLYCTGCRTLIENYLDNSPDW